MIPALPFLIFGKVLLAGGISLVGHRFAMRLQKSGSYETQTPAFIPQHHFGAMTMEGLVHGPMGKVTHRFTGTMSGRWDKNHGHIEKHYTFDNGESFQQITTLYIQGKTVTGYAENVKGKITGTLSGNTLHLTYAMTLPKHAGGLTVEVDDWYHVLENGTVMNRSQIRKLGYPIGDIAGTLRPQNG